jgi:Fic family protein
MLGVRDFCPTVRKTDKLQMFILKNLSDEAKKIIAKYPAEVVRKATQYLYTKETLTSFSIEREKPSPKRAAKFINMLENAAMTQKLGKELLIEVQNAVVDERFAMSGYRSTQNYIGESVGTRRIVHYVAPLHEDVGGMMFGLFESLRRMSGIVDPVVYAAAVSFALVYIHPFDDGNGRVHRYVIHHILKQEGFTPEGTIFPVSATMLANLQEYDKCLETFSKKIMSLLDFTIDELGEITVKNKTADHYRYMDLTHAAEYLYETVERTIKKEFVEELDFLVQRSHAVKGMRDVVDMPDKLIDLFIKIALEQNGQISKVKKKTVFHMLKDSEVDELEEIVSNSFKRPHAAQKP